jgi:KaiC domain protein
VSEDDEWFDRVLGGDDDGDGEDDVDGDADGESASEAGRDGSEPAGEEDGESGREDGQAGATAGDGATSEPDDSPFEQDFRDALDGAPEPDVGGGGTGFGGGGSGSGPGPGPGDAGQGDGFDDFGFGGGGGPSFDDAEETYDADIDRIDIGIEGLDDMILGGVPERSLLAVVGSAGTGKTTFGLQFLRETLEAGNRAVYITLEEDRDRIVSTADGKGWPFSEYVADDRLAVVDLDPLEMVNSLQSIRSELPGLVDEFGADRLVLDSVSLLEMMYDRPAERRSEVFDFTRSLKQAGVSILVTSEASADTPYASRYGIIEYLADAVFVLQYVRGSDFRETRLAVEIQKIRDANHSRETKPYEITNEGISVYRQANIF